MVGQRCYGEPMHRRIQNSFDPTFIPLGSILSGGLNLPRQSTWFWVGGGTHMTRALILNASPLLQHMMVRHSSTRGKKNEPRSRRPAASPGYPEPVHSRQLLLDVVEPLDQPAAGPGHPQTCAMLPAMHRFSRSRAPCPARAYPTTDPGCPRTCAWPAASLQDVPEPVHCRQQVQGVLEPVRGQPGHDDQEAYISPFRLIDG